MRENVSFEYPEDLFNNLVFLHAHNQNIVPDFFTQKMLTTEDYPMVVKHQYVFHFPNGFGASVIKGPGSYGYENDKWELGVLEN